MRTVFIYNVPHRVLPSTQCEQAVIILHLPTANRYKFLTEDVDKRDGGAHYTLLEWKNDIVHCRHVVSVTFTRTTLKTLIALREYVQIFKNAVSDKFCRRKFMQVDNEKLIINGNWGLMENLILSEELAYKST